MKFINIRISTFTAGWWFFNITNLLLKFNNSQGQILHTKLSSGPEHQVIKRTFNRAQIPKCGFLYKLKNFAAKYRNISDDLKTWNVAIITLFGDFYPMLIISNNFGLYFHLRYAAYHMLGISIVSVVGATKILLYKIFKNFPKKLD